MNNFYVYYLRRPDKPDPMDPDLGQPFYVGKGSNGRVNCHRKEAIDLLHKSGRKSYKISIIYGLFGQGLDFQEDIVCNNLDEQEAFDLEVEAIQLYGRKNNSTGILANLTDGREGASGVIRSEELRKRMSDARKGDKNPMYGKKQSEEANRKRSETQKGRISPMKGKHHTDEAKRKLSIAGLERKHSPESIERMKQAKLGHTVTEETKEKMRQARLGKVPWNKGKKGCQIAWNKGITWYKINGKNSKLNIKVTK